MKWMAVFALLALSGCGHPPAEQAAVKPVGGVTSSTLLNRNEPAPNDLDLCPGAVPCPVSKPAQYNLCRGDFAACCTHYSGVKQPAQNDGRGHVQCVDGEEYPRRDDCKCAAL